MVCYLLHFSQPICPGRHTAQHYLGVALDLDARIAEHRAGRGARLTQVACERGIGFEVVRTWPGSRAFERMLKERKAGPRLCPLCSPRRRCYQVAASQLQLPLDLDGELPDPPVLRMDGYEIWYTRQLRQARAAAAPLSATWDDGLL